MGIMFCFGLLNHNKKPHQPIPDTYTQSEPPDNMLDMFNMISNLQSERMDSQRAELRPIKKVVKETKATSLPGLRNVQTTSQRPEDDFLDMIARVQGTRLDDQRSELPRPKPKPQANPSIPDDDFFANLMRAQSGRMEDQRASLSIKKKTDNHNEKSSSPVTE